MIKKIFIFVVPVALAVFLFTNTTVSDPTRIAILQEIQNINTLLAQPSVSPKMREVLQGLKLYHAGRVAKHLGLANCNALKQVVPSLESGMYATYRTADADAFDLRFCDLRTNQDVEIQSNIVPSVQQPPSTSTYYETFSLRANNTTTPVRKELPGIVQVMKVIPYSSQNPCFASDYGFDNNGLWVKNKCHAQFMVLTAQGTRYLDAAQTTSIPVFKGEITDVRILATNQLQVQGWSCEVGNNQPIEVQLYLGDAGLNGVYMASQATTLAHPMAVGSQCQTLGSAKHQFSFTVDLQEKPTHSVSQKQALSQLASTSTGNDHVFVYAVSHKDNGFSMSRVNGSGVHRYKIGDIKGWVDSIVVENNQLLVKGWSCHVDDARSMAIDVYYGNKAGLPGAVLLGRKTANVNHEAAVSNICKGGGTAHRYVAQFPLANSNIPAGLPVYVYGINLVPGKPNVLLSGSGGVKIPAFNLQWNNLGKGWTYSMGLQTFKAGKWDAGVNCLASEAIESKISAQLKTDANLSFLFDGDCVSTMTAAGVAKPRVGISESYYRLRMCALKVSSGASLQVCTPFTNVSGSMPFKFSLLSLFANGVWVNKMGAETHVQTCTRVGLAPGSNTGTGVCASGERRPNTGGESNSIEYLHGSWGSTLIGGSSVIGNYCYAVGQKQDNNKTDLTVAYWCK